jgi:NitT/TauT family transport system substrate-binding protein
MVGYGSGFLRLQGADEAREGMMRGWVGGLAMLVAATALPARAEVQTLRIAHQPGMGHLQLRIMEADRLIEQEAQAAGLGALTVAWQRFPSQAAMHEALDAGALDLASGDIAELIQRWSDTKGAVIGLAATSALPLVLATNRAELRSLDDFTPRDRIALPAPGRSLGAVLLGIALERRAGPPAVRRLAALQVALPGPEAMAALIAGSGGITADFAAPPFLYQELARPKIHRVFGSLEIVPPRTTTGVVWGRARFFADNPRLTDVILTALETATQIIHEAPRRAAALYLAVEQPGWSAMQAEVTLRNPSHLFTTTPGNVMAVVEPMAKLGLKPAPKAWHELFTTALRARAGS